jgi:hypothetical protein
MNMAMPIVWAPQRENGARSKAGTNRPFRPYADRIVPMHRDRPTMNPCKRKRQDSASKLRSAPDVTPLDRLMRWRLRRAPPKTHGAIVARRAPVFYQVWRSTRFRALHPACAAPFAVPPPPEKRGPQGSALAQDLIALQQDMDTVLRGLGRRPASRSRCGACRRKRGLFGDYETAFAAGNVLTQAIAVVARRDGKRGPSSRALAFYLLASTAGRA